MSRALYSRSGSMAANPNLYAIAGEFTDAILQSRCVFLRLSTLI